MSDEGQISGNGDRAVSRGQLAEELESTGGSGQRQGDDLREQAEDDQTAIISRSAESSQPERLWAFGAWEADSAAFGEQAASDPYVGLINLGFIRAALRRKMAVWVSVAVIGLIGGFGFLVALPPAQQASTTLLLQSPAQSGPGVAIADDQAMIESRTVAADAIARLGLTEAPAVFLRHYTATILTNQLLSITVSAKSSATAIREANTLASTFLAFQRQMLDSQNELANASYTQQITAAQQSADALGKQISSLKAKLGTGHSDQLSSLEAQYNQQTTALGALKTTVANSEAINQTGNAIVIAGSRVLDRAAPVRQSRVRQIALYAGGGLVGGLAIGVAIVVIGALVSDRLRRRDDVARLLRAPVRLSVGPIRPRRWWPAHNGLALARHKDVQQVAAHLGNAVAPSASGPACLAVVPVGDARVPAVCLVSLAVSCAQQGLKAVVADLCTGAPAARLLKAREPGVREVSVRGTTLTLIVPDHDSGPIAGPIGKPRWPHASAPVASACKSADVVLTLASVDPALGAEYLTGWTSSVVAMVTAGESSAQRVFAVGEMIRLAGLQTASAVLVGADKRDESLGVVPGDAVSHEPEADLNGTLRRADGVLAIAESDLGVDSATEIASSNGVTDP